VGTALHCRTFNPPLFPVVLQEVEKQYKEGTLKHTLVAVLKAVQPEALTAVGEPPRPLRPCILKTNVLPACACCLLVLQCCCGAWLTCMACQL
jgi:hypothetical protein